MRPLTALTVGGLVLDRLAGQNVHFFAAQECRVSGTNLLLHTHVPLAVAENRGKQVFEVVGMSRSAGTSKNPASVISVSRLGLRLPVEIALSAT